MSTTGENNAFWAGAIMSVVVVVTLITFSDQLNESMCQHKYNVADCKPTKEPYVPINPHKLENR